MPSLPEPDWPLSDGVVLLRRFTLDDVSDVTRACQDPEIPRWTASIPVPYEEQHAREWISCHDVWWNEGDRAPFAFCSATTGELFGSMSLTSIDWDDRSADVGYWAGPWARNSGATTRALLLMCRWAFDSVDIVTLHLMTLLGNEASERVAEKAGFELMGTIDGLQAHAALHPETTVKMKHWVRRAGGGAIPAA